MVTLHVPVAGLLDPPRARVRFVVAVRPVDPFHSRKIALQDITIEELVVDDHPLRQPQEVRARRGRDLVLDVRRDSPLCPSISTSSIA